MRRQQPRKKSNDTIACGGGGCPATPVSPAEFCNYIVQHKWPKDGEVFDHNEGQVEPGDPEPFDRTAAFHIWGIGRDAHNVDKAKVTNLAKYDLIHTGLFNFLEVAGKDISEEGDVMLMIEGVPMDHTVQIRRHIVIISGVTWCPKVFECTRCSFQSSDHAEAEKLPCPSFV